MGPTCSYILIRKDWDPGSFYVLPQSSLEKDMATYSKILAWRIPWTEEPGAGRGYSPRGCKESDTTETTTSQDADPL